MAVSLICLGESSLMVLGVFVLMWTIIFMIRMEGQDDVSLVYHANSFDSTGSNDQDGEQQIVVDGVDMANDRLSSVFLSPADMAMAARLHFVHVPKTGGTTFTTSLRDAMCSVVYHRDEEEDCCRNPGFCQRPHRKCNVIMGCESHVPLLGFLNGSIHHKAEKNAKKPSGRNQNFYHPSITLLREPTSRLISAWFYRGHNPNRDFFQVREEFKERQDQGRKNSYDFDDYLQMHEYNNIMTRMFGANQFPYRDVAVNHETLKVAKDNLRLFALVGLNEAFHTSVRLLEEIMGVDNLEANIVKERDNSPPTKISFEENLKTNKTRQALIRDRNELDIELYDFAIELFCQRVQHYGIVNEAIVQEECANLCKL